MDKFAQIHARRAKEKADSQALSAELNALIGVPVQPPAPIERNELPELTALLRQCSPRHRQVLKALAENDFVPKRAAIALSVSPQFVSSALRKPEVRAAREALEAMAAEAVGVTAASVLARANSLVEEAILAGDRTNALRGLDMLAKATQAVPTAQGSRVNVGVQVMVPVEERYARITDAVDVKVIDVDSEGKT